MTFTPLCPWRQHPQGHLVSLPGPLEWPPLAHSPAVHAQRPSSTPKPLRPSLQTCRPRRHPADSWAPSRSAVWTISFNPHRKPRCPCHKGEETKAQKGYMTCPKAKAGSKPFVVHRPFHAPSSRLCPCHLSGTLPLESDAVTLVTQGSRALCSHGAQPCISETGYQPVFWIKTFNFYPRVLFLNF